MANEKAKELIAMIEVKEPNELIVNSWWGSFAKDYKEALQMAIEALEQEPCEDAISRQAVMYALCDTCELFHKNGEETCLTKCESYHFLATLPSVTPKEKTGRWTKVTNGRGGHECDLCHEYAPSYKSGDEYLTKYCPNCGARMEVENAGSN